jgi:hypothetical protein
MSEQDPRASRNSDVLRRWIDILNNAEFERMEDVFDPEYVEEIPQSGERVRGIENMRQILHNYPGGINKGHSALVETAEPGPTYVLTPVFKVVKLQGSGDMLAAYMRVSYPDGSLWYLASIITFRNGKILKQIDFFAAPFDPPGWRAQWVERMEQ